jgi:long-chain acyl-CoA synthetase
MTPSLTLLGSPDLWLTRGVTVNVSEYLRAAAASDPDGTALVEHRPDRRAVTWRELDTAADAVARALSGQGLVAGQRVALVMANRIDLPIAYYGILRGGMVAVPINPRSTTREIGRMLADSLARVVLCDEAGIAQVREAVTTEHVVGVAVVVDGAQPQGGETSFERFLADATGAAPTAPADAEALAVILYTSGTSGKPRGAMLTHRALVANTEQIARLDPPAMTPDDVCLGLLPMFHIYGLNCVLGQAVRQGATVVMVDGFDAAGMLDLIVAEQITNVPLAPPVIAAWAGRDDLREKLAGVTTILSGASALDPELAESFRESSGHLIEQGYGLTETAPVISTTHGSPRDAENLVKHGTVGRALPGIELRIVESGGADAAPGDPAEIWVRGDNLFSGYWPDGADGPDADGWYPTGDVGFVDPDGDLTLVDRLRELVIVSGFNVYPFEVEDVIAEVPGVAQVAVVGLPDEETGEAVVAFVVPDRQSSLDETTLVESVEAHCRTRLARFKQPRRTVVVTGLPHSATGKVAKGRLRALARSEDLGLGAP